MAASYRYLLLPNRGCQLPYLCPTVATYLSPNSDCQLLSVQVWLARLRLILGNLQLQYLPQHQQWLLATYLSPNSGC